MTELSALNVRITGDASDLQAALSQTNAALAQTGTVAQTAQTRAVGLTRGLGVLGNISNQTRSRIQNTAFQLQDLSVQLASGTRASTALAQQLPQLLGGFGAVGAVIGVLASVGIPALAFAFASSGEAAATFEDALERVEDAGRRLKQGQDILAMSNAELVATYGQHAAAVRDAAVAYTELAAASARAMLAERIQDMSEELRDFGGAVSSAFRSGVTYAQSLANISQQMGVTTRSAEEIQRALTRVQNAMTFEDRMQALRDLQTIFDNAGVAADTIPPALREALLEANSLAMAMAAVANEAERGAAAAAGMTSGVPLYNQPGGLTLPPAPAGGAVPAMRGGGGGGARSNPVQAQLESLQNSLMTQEEAQVASYERQQETLRLALEQRLITQQEYQAMMEAAQSQHGERMSQIDAYRYGSGLQQAEMFFGDMAGALANGNDAMMRASRSFAAAEALINAWRAYSQTIADPTLPWFAKLAAGAKVLGAGLAAVNAIKGGGKGGGGGAATSAASGGGGVSRNVFINLTGDTVSSRSVKGLIDQINDEIKRGGRINLQVA